MAVDAVEAIGLAQSLQPDILLLDVAMPKLSGLEALETLVDLAAPLKVILLTAAIGRADIVKALQLGARVSCSRSRPRACCSEPSAS